MKATIGSWLVFSCVMLVRSKDCTLEDFLTGDLFDSNFDTSGLESSYASGRQVRVGCNVGHTGFFKLICENDGTWSSKGTVCQPRSCGHPGDAAFADFHLENGDDFVFGSKVLYVCHKGYQMVSRRNFRRCLAEGWDGLVPVCEAYQCPVVHVKNNVKVTGDPEEASFGNVVRFSCKSSSEVLNGPPEIYCDENGEWSGAEWEGQPPKCEEIICRVPIIQNGSVPGEQDREYKENDLLSFNCNPGYKRSNEAASKCTKVGQNAEWSPTPTCEQIKCRLELPALSGTTYEPAYKSLYLPGETVTVTCGETYWIQDHHTTSAEPTCMNNGQWSIRPVCHEVRCPNQREGGVYSWEVSHWDRKRLGDRVRFTCRYNYKPNKDERRATCTRDGWTPKPLCEEILCHREDYTFADIVSEKKDVYKNRETVEYVCKTRRWETFTLVCSANGWSGNPQCASALCQRLDIENAEISRNRKATYRHGEEAEYTCSNDGGRRLTLTCENGVWEGTKSCTDNVPCPKVDIPNGFTAAPSENILYFTCDDGYKLNTAGWWGVAKCQGGAWNGLKQCIEKTKCGAPPAVPNGKATPQQTDDGAQVLEIACDEGYDAAVAQLTCRDGKWLSDRGSLKTLCLPSAVHCRPPPRVQNGVVLTPYRKEFLSGSEVSYGCRENFTMEGDDTIRCIAGKWEEKTTACIQKPCSPPEDILHGSYEIVFGKSLVFGTTIQYKCDDGYGLLGQGSTRTCSLDGWTDSVPTCERVTCKAGVIHSSLRVTGLPSAGESMEPGHLLQFRCVDELDLDGQSRIQCLPNGEWSSPFPTCSEKCRISGVSTTVRHDRVPANELRKGETLTFSCQQQGNFIQGNATVECLADGQWSHPFPTCAAPVSCGNPPPLVDGDTKESLKFRYDHNEKVEYICQSFYTMEGGPYRTCVNGQWSGEITCIKPCTVTREDLDRKNIQFKYTYEAKLYSAHNDEMEFMCKSGRRIGRVSMRQRCVRGVINLPSCG